ncbi:MAG: hypothetical protein AAFZ65_15380 [Planctomycetota bacterium]
MEAIETSARRVVLLGPQRERETLREVVDELGLEGPLATVTAGWEEREAEDAELAAHLGGRTRNLGLYPRAEEVFREDRPVRDLLNERFDRLRQLQTLYRMRLGPLLETARTLLSEQGPHYGSEVHGEHVESAIAMIRTLDAEHLDHAARLDAEIAERIGAERRGVLQRHQDELAEVLSDVGGLLIAGGHVGILLNRLRLFGVLELCPDAPIVAWSGGAMVLTDRIVLFHDSPPQGPGDAEIYAPGLGLLSGIVPLPHAKRRLRLDDPARVALFTRRFAPAECVALDAGCRVDRTADGGWRVPTGTHCLTVDGSLIEGAVA